MTLIMGHIKIIFAWSMRIDYHLKFNLKCHSIIRMIKKEKEKEKENSNFYRCIKNLN